MAAQKRFTLYLGVLASLIGMSLMASPPNIVLILADDLGYGELGCYGQRKIPTPNIDRLASEGVRFTRFYSPSPVCAPTRYSMLTGRHQGHAAIRGNKEQGEATLNGKEGQFPMPAGENTLAEILRRRGYRTGLIGKWGLGGPSPEQTPLDHGFDRFYGYLCQRRAHTHYPVYLWDDHQPDLLLGNRPVELHQRIDQPLGREEEYYERFGGSDYAAERMVQECRKFIRENRSRPFFLYYAPTLPHAAMQAPKEWVDRFPREWDTEPYLGQHGYVPTARPRATYAAMISYLDHTVGEIRRAIEEERLDKNTLVIFTSDNGATTFAGVDYRFFDSNGGLRAGKMSLYEGGIRVPFLAWWPGRIQAGATSDALSAGYDLSATLAELTGAKGGGNDGRSLLPTLLGGKAPARDHLYFEYPEASAMQAMVWDRFKAIRPDLSKNPDRIEVYDLESDPGETQDLASQRPDLVRKAGEAMKREHRPSRDFPLRGVDPF